MAGWTVPAGDRDPIPSSDVIETPSMPSRSRLYWGVYACAWAGFTAFFVLVRCVLQGGTVPKATLATLPFTGPAAVIGVGAVLLTRRWDWPPDSLPGFVAFHLVAAVAYSALWVASISLIVGLRRAALGGPFDMPGLDSSTLRLFFLFGVLIYGTITAVTYLARTVRRLHVERQRVARAEALQARSRLQAIRARVRPHFLYNVLHSATSLIRRAPDRAERALERLAELLRYATGRAEGRQGDEVTLRRELEMVRTYLELEKLRLGDRLSVERDVPDEAREMRIPPLTVQPLVENAIQHGIAPRAEGGVMTIEAELDGTGDEHALVVVVRDNGPGATEEDVEASNGTGLRLVRERLELRYDGRGGLTIESRPGRGFESRVRVPVEGVAGREGNGGDPR